MNKKITIAEPQWTQADTAAKLQAAIKLRIQNKFAEAEEKLAELLSAETPAGQQLGLRSVWLTNQIIKTQYQVGHYKEVGASLDSLIT